jgi:hypothetical protein
VSHDQLGSTKRAAVPSMLDGARVLRACSPSSFEQLSSADDGIWGMGPTGFVPFKSVAVCAYEEETDTAVYVFRCGEDWHVLADDWYESLDEALGHLEEQYPGIGAHWRIPTERDDSDLG